MSWNYRGLGNSQTVQRLGEIHKRFSPDITFLTETKNSNDFVLRKCDSLEYPNSSLVPPTGHSVGGLAHSGDKESKLMFYPHVKTTLILRLSMRINVSLQLLFMLTRIIM